MCSWKWWACLGLLTLGGVPTAIAAQEVTSPADKPDPWAAVRFLAGEWEGTATGEPGTGTVKRSYSFVLGDRYLFEKNVSTYPTEAENKSPEIHEHWSFFSRDRGRRVLILRQFHTEGFVNEYALDTLTIGSGKLVFNGERYENFDDSWQLRETYQIISPDEFVEVFEIGAPGKALQVYSTNHFKRVKQ